MSKVLTKKIQTQLSDYFSSDSEMTKPETRYLKDMVLGILKNRQKIPVLGTGLNCHELYGYNY